MEARVKKDTCIGCGACTAIANNFFEIGDDGLAETIAPFVDEELKSKTVTEQDKDDVLDAYESCPVGAIEVNE